MSWWTALASIGGSLLGKVVDKRQQSKANVMNSPQGIRNNAEAAGFNPLVFAGPGVGTGAPYSGTMGTTIAQGFTQAAQEIDDMWSLRAEKTQLEQERNRLEKEISKVKLKPKVPGVYGHSWERTNGRTGTGTREQQAGGDTAGDVAVPVDPLRADRANGAGQPTNYNRVEAPAVKLGGVPFTGSGLYSTGESVEDAIGESPLSWIAALPIAGDMVGHTIGQFHTRWQQKRADEAVDEWFERVRTGRKISSPKPRRSTKQKAGPYRSTGSPRQQFIMN